VKAGDLVVTTGGLTVTAGGIDVQTGVTVNTGGVVVTTGGADITNTADATIMKAVSSHNTFTADALLLQTKTASGTGFNLIRAQVDLGGGGQEVFKVDGTGAVIVSAATDTASSLAGSIRTAGGLGVKLKAHVGGDTTVQGDIINTATTDPASSLEGAIRTAGGLGVKLKANVGGNLNVGALTISTDNTDSGSSLAGAITTAGGLGVKLKTNIGGNLDVAGLSTLQQVDIEMETLITLSSAPRQLLPQQ
jgi:hypothetical protein